MKKIVALFLILSLCLCGCSLPDNSPRKTSFEDEIIFPSIPTPIPAEDLPTVPQDSSDPDGQDTQPAAPAEKRYPWEEEFDGTDYSVRKDIFEQGTAFSWIKGTEKARQVTYYNNGQIEDIYYYPSGMISHIYVWSEDGSYSEVGFLDNSYIETAEDGSKIMHMGTQVFSKTINADGSWEETHCNYDGIARLTVRQNADGSAQEERYDEEGFMTYYHSKQVDYEIELLADESGKLVQAIENGQTIEDPAILAQYAADYHFRN